MSHKVRVVNREDGYRLFGFDIKVWFIASFRRWGIAIIHQDAMEPYKR